MSGDADKAVRAEAERRWPDDWFNRVTNYRHQQYRYAFEEGAKFATAALDAMGQPSREQLSDLIARELAADSEGFGSCDFPAHLADAILALYPAATVRTVGSVEHGPVMTWRNNDGPEHESNKCKCGQRWPHEVASEYPPVPASLAVEFASGADATESWHRYCDEQGLHLTPAAAPTVTP